MILKKYFLFFLFFMFFAPFVMAFELDDYGDSILSIDYEKYGFFEDYGDGGFRYILEDEEGLKEVMGTGIFPNFEKYKKEKRYKTLVHKLGGEFDDFRALNYEENFYKFCSYTGAPFIRQLEIANILENMGEKLKLQYYESKDVKILKHSLRLLQHALKGYYSTLLHFTESFAMTEFKIPWNPSILAYDGVVRILNRHPEMGITWDQGYFKIANLDSDIRNDQIIFYPGTFRKSGSPSSDSIMHGKVKKRLSSKKSSTVVVEQYEGSRHWQLFLHGMPFIVKGIAYNPTPVGQSPESNTLADWTSMSEADLNNNNLLDGPYDSWVDKNKNNFQDDHEKTIGDWQLLKDMGVNTLRIYHAPDHKNLDAVLSDLYEKYGIMTMIGNFFGMYAKGSGQDWKEGTDYTDKHQRNTMFEEVKKMVMKYKDKPYVLFWVLGNENFYGVANNSAKYPKQYCKFVNKVAKWIHKVDPQHPVILCNGDLFMMQYIKEYASAIDIYGANVYRGQYGFGESFWSNLFEDMDKPVLITEYGVSAYYRGLSVEQREIIQSNYHKENWMDITNNLYGKGYGNAIGGVVFEWMDEWWKAMRVFDSRFLVNRQEPNFKIYDTDMGWRGPFPGGIMYEEWLGLSSQGDGRYSPYLRQLRHVYYMYKELWGKSP